MESPFKPGDTYKKRYRINQVGRDGATRTLGIPPEVIEKHAEAAGITPEEFCRTYQAVAQYNSFPGLYYEFEPIPEKIGTGSPPEPNDTTEE